MITVTQGPIATRVAPGRRSPSRIGACRDDPRSPSSCPPSTRPRSSAMTVKTVVYGMRDRGEDFELLIVENGSTDGTFAIAEQLEAEMPEVRIEHRDEADYGRALRVGPPGRARRRGRQLRHGLLRPRLPRCRGSRRCLRRSGPRSSSVPSAARVPPITASRCASSRPRLQHDPAPGVPPRRVRHPRHQGDAARRGRALRPRLHVRPGPLRHRADPAGRTGGVAHGGDPGRGRASSDRRAARSCPGSPYAARSGGAPLGVLEEARAH